MIDWTDAFDNSGYVDGSERLAEEWRAAAQAFRSALAAETTVDADLAYGPGARNVMDVFRPTAQVSGVVVFVHGGYWMSLDKSYWSHLAAGPLAKGWTVAIPSYTLAPQARIAQVTREVAMAVAFVAALLDGPLRLIGHSAGGHLVARMMCRDSPLRTAELNRIEKIMSVSGVHDLRPLLETKMNDTLQLDADEAYRESPALATPIKDISAAFWVGAAERPEFLRQSRLIAEAWERHGALVTDVYEPGKNHFSVIESLADSTSPLVKELVS